MERLRKKTTKEILWIYILRLLSERDMYAYELKAALQERFGIDPARVTPYVVLYRLEREGYVDSSWKEKKKYYHTTEKGRELLDKGIKYLEELMEKLMV